MESVRRDLGEIVWVAFPKIAGGAAQVAVNVALMRSFGPEAFGQVAVCMSAVMLCDSLLGSAIDMSIFRLAPAAKSSYSLQIQKSGLMFKLLGGAIAAVPLALSAGSISRLLFQSAQHAEVLFLTFLALVGSLLIRSTQVNFQIDRRFSRYGITDLINNAFRFGLIAALIASRTATPARVMLVYALTPILVAGAVLGTWARPMARVASSRSARSELWGTLRWYLATVVAGAIVTRMDLFFVSSVSGVKEAGIYSAAQLYAMLPQLLGLYISAAFSPRVMGLWNSGQFRHTYYRYQIGLAILAVCWYVSAVAFIPWAGPVLFPAAFRKSGNVIVSLLPAGLAAFVSFPWTIPFLLYLRARTMLLIDVASIPLLCIALYVASRYAGAMGAARVTSVFMLARAGVHQWLALRVMGRDGWGGQREASAEFPLVESAA